jgi:hypothetical protein
LFSAIYALSVGNCAPNCASVSMEGPKKPVNERYGDVSPIDIPSLPSG